MKTNIKLLAILLLIATSFNPLLAQTQIGQDITGTRAEYSYNCPSLSFDGNRMAVAFTDRVKVYELVNNIWQQIGSDVITGGSPEVSLSADGDRFAITIYNPEIGRVYDFINGDWVQVGADFDIIVNAYSFQKVAISPDGNRVALGAMKGNTVEVRELNGGNWVPIGSRLTGESVFDRFGSSVAVSWDGSVLAAGAITNDGNGNSSGHVRVFEWSGGDWVQIGADLDGEYYNDESGWSVSLSADGSRVAVGAPYQLGSIGHVRIYERAGNSWVRLGDDIDGGGFNSLFGISVSMSADGNRVAVSAPTSSYGDLPLGYTQVYEWTGANWVKISGDIMADNEDDYQGKVSISGDGNKVAVAAPSNGLNSYDGGYVRVYNSLLALPIELSYFKAEAANKTVLLKWTTASEINNKGFDIEHSTDGTTWQKLDFVRGQGTSSITNDYMYTHTNPTNGINYYRLKQLDFDGAFEYSKVVNAHISGRGGIDIFPNPSSESIAISGITYDTAKITDTSGRSVLTIENAQPNIDISHLANGMYFIEIVSGNSRMVKKIVKE